MRRKRALLIGSALLTAIVMGLPGVPAVADGPADDVPSVTVPPATVQETGAPAWQGGGLALDQGRLFVGTDSIYPPVYGSPADDVTAADVSVAADGTPSVGAFDFADILNGYINDEGRTIPCTGDCRRLTASGWAHVTHTGMGSDSYDTTQDMVAASGGYEVLRKGSPQRQYVFATRSSPGLLSEGDPVGAALWENTLWTAGTGAQQGTVTAAELPAMTPGQKVDVGATCAITDLQVVAHWIYWSCGPDAHAAVYDLASGRLTPVDSGYAMLGDGYLVTQDTAAATLRISYLPQSDGDALDTRDLADLPSRPGASADQRGLYWTVDRFGGGAAVITADGGIRVMMPRVTTTGMTLVPGAMEKVANERLPNPLWQPDFSMSKPASSWTLQIRDAAGSTVWTTSGGPVRGHLHGDDTYQNHWPNWIGRDSSGQLVPSGTYRWVFSATAADRASDTATISGQLEVKAVEFHSFGAQGSLVFTSPSGAAAGVVESDGRGGLPAPTARKLIPGWQAGDLAIPFGDILGYRCNDLLVRTPQGELKEWQGDCDDGFPIYPDGIRDYSLGTGWNQYTFLVSAGDETGDRRADLLAEDKNGDLWLYANNGKGGFDPRVKAGWSLSGYTMLVGGGDLDGDGIGDLLARDTSGNLWRWSGDGAGSWLPKEKIGTGFNTLTSLTGAGDITGDGKPDLVGRDASGNLWRRSGDGTGGVTGPVKIATDWQAVGGLY
ncbi:FG-GAP-like repeat-containing protein [Streptomyces polygonati]|uniref:FG-GAP-like repeat-containing protein n=1 Tax=Streptomyces polygonati TaxID=1617087 RepID=A0ABV8HR93_9ACTN